MAGRLASMLVVGVMGCSYGGQRSSSVAPESPAMGTEGRAVALEAPAPRGAGSCAGCDAVPLSPDVTRAIEKRVADLRTRGGACSTYGAVLASSFRSGQIKVRRYMWRVGSQLASGEARPNGEMMLAQEIDSLNVGLRTVDELLWTMEHEAAHIAFNILSGSEAGEAQANEFVRACKS